jgi:hypothetical protein
MLFWKLEHFPLSEKNVGRDHLHWIHKDSLIFVTGNIMFWAEYQMTDKSRNAVTQSVVVIVSSLDSIYTIFVWPFLMLQA